MTPIIMCTCGRLKWTSDDLERWEAELKVSGEEALPLRQRTFNPEWARAICWMMGTPCPMRKLEVAK